MISFKIENKIDIINYEVIEPNTFWAYHRLFRYLRIVMLYLLLIRHLSTTQGIEFFNQYK